MIMHCYEHKSQNTIIFFLWTGRQLYKSDTISHLEPEEQLSKGIGLLQCQSLGELQEEPSQWVSRP